MCNRSASQNLFLTGNLSGCRQRNITHYAQTLRPSKVYLPVRIFITMIYTRGFFKHKALRFDLPGKIDETFYLDIKKRISDNPHFKFESDVSLWDLYKGLFMVFLLTILSCIILVVFLQSGHQNIVFLFILFAIIIIGMRPSIYFGMLLFHFLKYRRAEKRFHADFKKAIAQSDHFPAFVGRFYVGRYSETALLNVYHFTSSIELIKEFVEAKDLASYVCIYKHSKGENYIVLSNSVEVIWFIEKHAGVVLLGPDNSVLQVVKQQVVFPFVYGNKKLKYLIV
jgi:hypothetical protein